MDDPPTAGPDDPAADLLFGLRGSPEYWEHRRFVKSVASRPQNQGKDVAQLMRSVLVKSGRQTSLHNASHHHRRAVDQRFAQSLPKLPPGVVAPPRRREPLQFLQRQHERWRLKQIKRVSMVLRRFPTIKLAVPHTEQFQSLPWDKLMERTTEAPLEVEMFIYDASDLYKELVGVVDPNFNAAGRYQSSSAAVSALKKPWGTIKVQLKSPSVIELRVKFSDLGIERPQFGIDNEEKASGVQESFLDLWESTGDIVLQRGLSNEAQAYARRGCPNHHRRAIWELVLCRDLAAHDRAYYAELCAQIRRHSLFADHLVAADAKRLGGRNDDYFVFEDIIKQTLLVMSRDANLRAACSDPKPMSLKVEIGGSKHAAPGPVAVCYPPSGILPFKGLAYYVAPLCFVHSDPMTLYRTFRALYTRYFCQLHVVSSSSEGLLRLCTTFEQLLQAHDPTLCTHFAEIGFDPLSVALPWICCAFSGVLPPDQVLLVWDRIVGFDTLAVLPMLAVAIFSFRRSDLFKAQNAKFAEKVLSDSVALKATSMLQCFLFGDPLLGVPKAGPR